MAIEIPKNIDLDNPEFQNAWDLINHTHQSIFLTGKAGTGKSTFLRYICANTRKKYVILAPTGIAAVNVGGVTMHSFFKMPFKPLLPDDPDYLPRTIRKTLRFPRDKVKLIKELDLIIIDEISMVRSDMIDYMDRVLRIYNENMREPFGGKQLLLVGDIFQLEPVVTSDMRSILKRYYNNFFFFNANAFHDANLVPIELRKIYRQTDSTFVSMLDRVRVNHATKQDIQLINSRCLTKYDAPKDSLVMTLATRRDTVDSINEEHMNELTSKEYVFEGKIEGTFPSQNLPTSQRLAIKEGAQVIFIRNDKEGRWINGTLGKVCSLSKDNMKVELESGDIYDVVPEIWENMQYAYNEEKKVVVENVLGTFKQYPVKPAWALTVHKSQGLTFNNIIIDFAGGAFSSGQTYVALSRCTSLEGIVMLRPIDERDIIVNPQVVEFSHQFNDKMLISDAMNKAKANDLYNRAVKAFEKDNFANAIEMVAEAMSIDNIISEPLTKRFASVKLSRITRYKSVILALKKTISVKDAVLNKLAAEYVSLGAASVDMETEGIGCLAKDAIAVKAAFANFDKALSINPNCADAILCKAKLLAAIGELDSALSLIYKANDVCPDDYGILFAKGCISFRADDLPTAIKSFKKAIKVDKQAIKPHEMLYEIYDKIGLDEFADRERAKIEKLRKAESRMKK